MPNISGLRSPYAKVGRLVYFGRMLDKIRLHKAGKLPPEYVENLGETSDTSTAFDARCCRFLGVKYVELVPIVLAGDQSDDDVLKWAHKNGHQRTDEECEIWNMFMSKRGWRDVATARVKLRAEESGLQDKPIVTMFDYIDYDEGRENATDRPWERI